jgi:hypothetical protein
MQMITNHLARQSFKLMADGLMQMITNHLARQSFKLMADYDSNVNADIQALGCDG